MEAESHPFFHADLRVGTVLTCEPNPKARKPAYVITVDFGPDIGVRTSSAQITHLAEADQVVGRQVIGVVNLPPKRIAGVKSEFLTLGPVNADGLCLALLTVDRPMPNGLRIG